MDNINFTSNITKIKLNNGVTILLERLPYFKSVTLGFFLKKGSRDENDNERGYAHFCEHMLFKGTTKHKKDAIAEIFDEMGGYINAYTTNELVVVYNKVPYFNLESTIDLIYQIYSDSLFDTEEVELERDVILNEINSTLEDPQDKVSEDFMSNLFPNQGLGHPIIGSTNSINESTRDGLYNFYNKMFTGEDLIIAISGNIDIDAVTKQIENFKFKSRINNNDKLNEQSKEKMFFTKLNSEQLHIMGGTSKFLLTKETYLHSNILNIILGETMSSRLFQKVREDLGLCYSIYSFIHKYRDENVFGIYTSVMPKSAKKTIAAISDVIKNLIKDGITLVELDKAKQQKIGEIILNSDILQKRGQFFQTILSIS
ncbi:MAG TPA: pitrilysin family protein, partial [Spirochaetota bacterium]|nr:pitrilysin family protein [Spirochaetota bacterium]